MDLPPLGDEKTTFSPLAQGNSCVEGQVVQGHGAGELICAPAYKLEAALLFLMCYDLPFLSAVWLKSAGQR